MFFYNFFKFFKSFFNGCKFYMGFLIKDKLTDVIVPDIDLSFLD